MPAIGKDPLFKNRILNKAIILKHKLRGNELDLFESHVGTATKVLLPIDAGDLRSGAHYFFVGQKDFEAVTEEVFGNDLRPGSRDRNVLDQIDELPSLDPFLLREYLRRTGIEPAREYFNISDADILNMQKFVQEDIQALSNMSGGEIPGMPSSRLADKLLSPRPEADFGPLREVLRLEDRQFLDGIFAWRGFLYYKWVLSDLMPRVDLTIKGMTSIVPRGLRDAESAAYLPLARTRIAASIRERIRAVEVTLGLYDRAFCALTIDGKPQAFRDFLIDSPGLFMSLGQRLGVLQHIVSFWSYRFPKTNAVAVSYCDLMDILMDFEDGIALETEEEDAPVMQRSVA